MGAHGLVVLVILATTAWSPWRGSAANTSYLEPSPPSPPDAPFSPPSPPTSPNPAAGFCDPVDFSYQVLALLLFYIVTGGDYWIDHTGWPSTAELNTLLMDDGIINQVVNAPSNCTKPYSNQTVLLPTQCCWFGVHCCLSNTCDSHRDLTVDACECTVGAVTGLSMPFNNLTGSLDGLDNQSAIPSVFSVISILYILSCNLRGLALQNNHLSGGLPSTLTTLSELQTLNLGYNQLTGTLPTTLGNMTAFQVLELTNNNFTGPIPADLCREDGNSPLTDLFFGNNMLTGTLDTSRCRQLILLSGNNNRLSGTLPSIAGYPFLHIVHLSGNNFSGYVPGGGQEVLFSGMMITDLDVSDNQLNGSVPDSLADLIYMTNLDLHNNSLTGTLPPPLFSYLGTLVSADFSVNRLTGTIPTSIGQSLSLSNLDLSYNNLTGTVPHSLVKTMGKPNRVADFRFNNLSCCGLGFNYTTLRYTSYNLSAPLLPEGLSQSTTLRFVATLGQNYQGLSCPYLYLSGMTDSPDNFLSWYFDPPYFLFANCSCLPGFVITNLSTHAWALTGVPPNVTCLRPDPPVVNPTPWWHANPWIWAVIAVGVSAVFLAVSWWCIFRRGSRPVMLQNLIDMRKRLRGPPQGGGLVSIVVTDIQGFSDLMKQSPVLTTEALMMHNNIVRKAKWANFGFTIEQEGDSYAIAFHEAADAVKFTIQAQQLLARQDWPSGLFSQKPPGRSSKAVASMKIKRAGTVVLAGIANALDSVGNSVQGYLARGGAEAHATASSRRFQPHLSPKQSSSPTAAQDGSHHRPIPPADDTDHAEASLRDSSRQQTPASTDSVAAANTRPAVHALQVDLVFAESEPHAPSVNDSGRRPAILEPSSSRRIAGPASHEAASGQHFRESAAIAEHNAKVFARARSLPGHHSSYMLDGLRVRMGVATGRLPVGTAPAQSVVMESAKTVSDAASGGQVLMCSATFRAVQHLLEELGCVDHDGTNLVRLNAQRAPWWIIGARKQEKEEAVLLDMGHYVHCPAGHAVPVVLTPDYLMQLKLAMTKQHAGLERGSLGLGGTMQRASAGGSPPPSPGSKAAAATAAPRNGSNAPSQQPSTTASPMYNGTAGPAAMDLAAIYREDRAGEADAVPDEHPSHWLQLYQVLSPNLIARGRYFGSKVALKREWVPLDVPYFSAPGALYAPLSSTDTALVGLELPAVTIVFCTVDGGKQYARMNRQDARLLHRSLEAVIRSVLRQVPGSYFVKEQDGDLKFMLAFRHPGTALVWCMAVQECAMYVDWPPSALRQWPEVWDHGQLLFRGPRLKMGVCEGQPRSILPDYLGRADYCGSSVNQAARYMDAAAHGGQVACEEPLLQHVAHCWSSGDLDEWTSSPSLADEVTEPSGNTQFWEEFAANNSVVPGSVTDSGVAGQQQQQQHLGSSSHSVPPPSGGRPRQAAAAGAGAPGVSGQEVRRTDSGWSSFVAPPSVSGRVPLKTWEEQDEGAEATAASPGMQPSTLAPAAVVASGGVSGAPGAQTPGAGELGTGAPQATGPSGVGVTAHAESSSSPSTTPAANSFAATADNAGGPSGLRLRATREPSYNHFVPDAHVEIVALHLGHFKFKGSPESLSMVHVTPAFLASRRFPREPPQGKGERVAPASGLVVSASAPLLSVVDMYRRKYELLRTMNAAGPGDLPDRTRSVGGNRPQSGGGDRSPRVMFARSWASMRAASSNFGRRSSGHSGGRAAGSPGSAQEATDSPLSLTPRSPGPGPPQRPAASAPRSALSQAPLGV